MPSQIENTRHVSQTKQSIRGPINVLSDLLPAATHESKTQRHVSHTKLAHKELFFFSLKQTIQTSRAHVSHQRIDTAAPQNFSLFLFYTTWNTCLAPKTIVLLLNETHKTDFPRAHVSHTNESARQHEISLLFRFLAGNNMKHMSRTYNNCSSSRWNPQNKLPARISITRRNNSHGAHQCAFRDDTEPFKHNLAE